MITSWLNYIDIFYLIILSLIGYKLVQYITQEFPKAWNTTIHKEDANTLFISVAILCILFTIAIGTLSYYLIINGDKQVSFSDPRWAGVHLWVAASGGVLATLFFMAFCVLLIKQYLTRIKK